MKTTPVLCVAAFAVMLQAMCATAAGGERQQQQLPLFFQAGRPFNAPGAPLPKFVGIAGNQPPQAFRTAPPQVDEEQEDEEQRNDDEPHQRNVLAPTPLPFRPQPTPQFNQFRASPSPSPQTLQPIRINRPTETPIRRPQPPSPSQYKPLSSQPLSEEAQELEEEKEEEPDRLTQLLPQSKFTCGGKTTGYYADEGLDCEVFHYCQDSARHSWICPEGFVFHQINLICMPPSGDNICKQSTQYHFVNDFLYRPVNTEEANSRPNVTLRYGDRYHLGSSLEAGEEYDQEERQPQPQFRQQPVPRQRIQQQQPQPTQQHVLSTPRPVQLLQHQQLQHQQLQQPQQPQFARQPSPNQVFHSSEEINIPLQQRRPVVLQQQRPSFQQQQQQLQQQQQQQNDFDFRRK